MATQIFIEPELESLHENAEEWSAICQELGLDKQLQKSGKVEKVGNPYQKVDPRSQRVFEMLYPVKREFREYDAGTLPLEVLQEIQRCQQNEWFPKIEVWYDDKSPDPFLIGYDSKEWSANKFIIARWGDELLPFEQLVTKAIARFKASYSRALDRLMADCQVRKADVEGDIQGYIDHGDQWNNNFEFPKFNNPIR
jgi:hypothetical protein